MSKILLMLEDGEEDIIDIIKTTMTLQNKDVVSQQINRQRKLFQNIRRELKKAKLK